VRTALVVYVSSDDALLLWSADAIDDGCLGFAVERRLRRAGGPVEAVWLDNYAPPPRTPGEPGAHQSSLVWPFRRFTWTDHDVGLGDRVSYRVVPVFAAGPDARRGSRWSRWRRVGPAADAKYAAYANRGLVISQFLSRYLNERYPGLARTQALARFKRDAAGVEDRMRRFLSGELRTALLEVVAATQRDGGHVYAALFELGDRELIDALAAVGPRAHVVLANGSVEVRKDPVTGRSVETSAQARARDENRTARRALLAAGVDVARKDRFVSPGALAHNKFLVLTDAAGRPRRVWTGSTNWTTTGLCTQLNNGLLIRDRRVAAAYLAQWRALRSAASTHPRELATANGTPSVVDAGRVRASVHFTRARGRVDLAALRELVRAAREGVLFLMFMPGGRGLFADVQALRDERPDLLVRGVVSTLPKGREDEKTGATTTVEVRLVGGAAPRLDGTARFDVVQPQGRRHPTAHWAAETMRRHFFAAVGHAIVHSKLLVVDPFSDDPVVVTGSHNFSLSASGQNDENFVVVRGERRLAEAYAVHVQTAWRHYASRLDNPHPELFDEAYLRALLADQRPRNAFWRLGPG
jgi:phosphatidylserine/phosphatidylglycerophosphate/cardiolipin synthase-like enzyme